MTGIRRGVLVGVILLFILWMTSNFRMLTEDEGSIRLAVGGVLAASVLFRRKQFNEPQVFPRWLIPVAGVAGALLAVGGIVSDVQQFEWLGIILVLLACLQWALPRPFSRDILLSLFLLYWVHPLPWIVFGKVELAMQMLSVQGTEWFCHALNVRVWADGFLLHSGLRVFGVPESCSGLRTATTVALCTLGVGILFHHRWHEVAAFLVLGTAQVLVLNILRIYFMVVWSSRMPPEWANTFLHDTLGIFLLVSIALVQAEASAWQMKKRRLVQTREAIERGELERPDKATILPRFWQWVVKWGVAAAVIAVLCGALAVGVYRHRPAHRAAMIRDVLEGLMERDLATAEKAVNEALRLAPDRDLRGKRVNILVRRGKFSEGLEELNRMGALDTYEIVMKSWALMALGRAEESIALVEALPEGEKAKPGVAMIRAEYGARRGKVAEVARDVVLASASVVMANRVRALFPYLALHQQWRAIVESDNPAVPYREGSQALVAAHAHLEMNNRVRAAQILKAALAAWPGDARFLGSLYTLATRTPGGEWEQVFGETLTLSLPALDADRLAQYMDYCFKMNRPDLGWVVYRRLEALDPRDPALAIAPARFGDQWFTFRRHTLGMAAPRKEEKINLRPFYLQTRGVEPFRAFWAQVPLAAALSDPKADPIRTGFLKTSLEELARREKEGRLTRRMDLSYPTPLMMAGRYDEAMARLDRLEKKYPDLRHDIQSQRAAFYDQQGRFQKSYELLRPEAGEEQRPNLAVTLMRLNAMMNLNLGVAAMEVADEARRVFPDSPQVVMAMASIWDAFGFKDHALFVLGGVGVTEWNAPAMAQLLYETGRFQEAERMSRSLNIDLRRQERYERQVAVLAPAELTLARRWPAPLSAAAMESRAAALEKEAREADSPFIRDLARLEAAWHRAGGKGEASDPSRWVRIGRDTLEQVTALHHLTQLLARQKDYEAATRCARQAVSLRPQSAVLWRVLIRLTEGEAETVGKAAVACPSDPEIWLAWLTARMRDRKAGRWAEDEVESAASRNAFSPDTLVRAGHFLLGNGMTGAAAAAAKHAIGQAGSSLPACVLGLRCAVKAKDLKWALACCLNGIENAKDPAPFYKMLVTIKAAGKTEDADLVSALEYLQGRLPKETQWAQILGDVYFQKGEMNRALSVLSQVVAGDQQGVRVRSFLLAAEAARQKEDFAKAVSVLETAYRLHPESPEVLNNLVYTLVQADRDGTGLARARALLPELLARGEKTSAYLDTAAMVCMRSGDLAEARKYMDRALENLSRDDYSRDEIRLNAAELLYRQEDYANARRLLETLKSLADRSALVDLGIKDLTSRIDKAERKR